MENIQRLAGALGMSHETLIKGYEPSIDSGFELKMRINNLEAMTGDARLKLIAAVNALAAFAQEEDEYVLDPWTARWDVNIRVEMGTEFAEYVARCEGERLQLYYSTFPWGQPEDGWSVIYYLAPVSTADEIKHILEKEEFPTFVFTLASGTIEARGRLANELEGYIMRLCGQDNIIEIVASNTEPPDVKA
jgi:hypothetical protein